MSAPRLRTEWLIAPSHLGSLALSVRRAMSLSRSPNDPNRVQRETICCNGSSRPQAAIPTVDLMRAVNTTRPVRRRGSATKIAIIAYTGQPGVIGAILTPLRPRASLQGRRVLTASQCSNRPHSYGGPSRLTRGPRSLVRRRAGRLSLRRSRNACSDLASNERPPLSSLHLVNHASAMMRNVHNAAGCNPNVVHPCGSSLSDRIE